MGDKIRCPKCKEITFDDAYYSIIREETIYFSGRCSNCGYEITGDSLFEQLKRKFDLEKDVEGLEGPLESVLSKVNSSQQEIRNRILESLIKIYDQKAKQSSNEDEVEKYFYKKIGCEQALEGKKCEETDVLEKLRFFYRYEKKWLDKAAQCIERAISLEPSEPEYHSILAMDYAALGKFEEAIKHLDIYYASKNRPAFPSTKEIEEYDQNNYWQRRGELLFKKGAYEEAISFLQRVKYTPNMMKHMIEPEWIRVRQGGEVKTTSDCTILSEINNIYTNQLLLKAFFGLKDYDHAMEAYDEILSIDPGYDLLAELWEEGEDELLFSLLKTLMEKDIDKAFEIVREIEPEDWEESNEAMVFLVYFLKGDIYLKYYFSGDREQKELLHEANKCFESVDSVFEDNCWGRCISDFFSNYYYKAPNIWEPLFGPVERILPEAHKNRGRVLEELGKPDEALVEYKKVAAFDGYSTNKEITDKIGEMKSKLANERLSELSERMNELQKELGLSSLPRSEKNVAKRIKLNLECIIEQLSEIKEQLPEIKKLLPKIRNYVDNWQKLGFDIRYVLRDCRLIIECLFDKVCEKAEHQYPGILPKKFDKYGKPLEPSPDSRVIALRNKKVINAFAGRLFSLVWDVGGKSGHDKEELAWVEKLEIEDVEVIVSTVVRVLKWYVKNYKNREGD